MAQFGAEASTPFDDLNRLVNELLVASHTKSRLATTSDWSLRSEEALDQHHKESIANDRIYYSGGKEDPIAPRIVKIITDIENKCQPIINKSDH